MFHGSYPVSGQLHLQQQARLRIVKFNASLLALLLVVVTMSFAHLTHLLNQDQIREVR
jgi:hypothetical protein